MISTKDLKRFTEFYEGAAKTQHLTARESILIRLATSMALGCGP